MHLVAPLIAGIRGCENGTVQLFARGTSQRASYWLSFEADQQISTGADLNLDANGGVEVYVGQLVDVVVRSSAGLTVRNFTAGEEAPAIEVRSPSFTGVDYVTGASAAGNPTTLQVALDRLKTSFGAVDFNVLIGSTATPMSAFAAAVSGIYFNVKDPTYGAKGDAVTDDTGAIQAALTAAQATFPGGTVVFPRGIYRTTSALSLPKGVSMLGVGIDSSVIKLDHATANTVSVTGGTAGAPARSVISGMSFRHTQANSGNQLQLTDASSNVACYDCFFDMTGVANTGRSVSVGAVAGTSLRLVGCRFSMAVGSRAVVVSSGEVYALFCNTIWSAGAYGTTAWQFDTGAVCVGCRFDSSAVTSGSFFSLSSVSLNDTDPNAMIGCNFVGPAGGTHQVSGLRCLEFGTRRSSTVVFVINAVSSSFLSGSMDGVERTYRQVSLAVGAFTIPDDTGTTVMTCSNAGAYTFTAPGLTIGRRFRLYLHNTDGVNRALAFVAPAGVDSVNGPAITLNTGTYTQLDFEAFFMNAKAVWRYVVTDANRAAP